MPQIMEAKVVSPCPLKCADPSVLEGVCVLPLSKKTATDSWHFALQASASKVI